MCINYFILYLILNIIIKDNGAEISRGDHERENIKHRAENAVQHNKQDEI